MLDNDVGPGSERVVTGVLVNLQHPVLFHPIQTVFRPYRAA